MARKKTNVGQQQFGFPDEDLKTSLHDEIVLWLKKNAIELSKRLLSWRGSWDTAWVEKLRSGCARAVEERRQQLRTDLKAGVLWRQEGDRDQEWQEPRSRPSQLQLMEQYLSFLESWKGLGDPPPPRIEVTSALEVPITRERYKTLDIVGYADIVFSISASHLSVPTLPVDNSGRPLVRTGKLDWFSYLADPSKIAHDAKSTIPSLGQLIRDLNTYRNWRTWPFVVVSPDARFADAIADEGFGFIQYPEGVFLQPSALRQPKAE
jgi:hypothetical protein